MYHERFPRPGEILLPHDPLDVCRCVSWPPARFGPPDVLLVTETLHPPVVRYLHAQLLTLSRVSHQAITVTFTVGTLAHVHLARLVILVVVQFGLAFAEQLRIAQILAAVLLVLLGAVVVEDGGASSVVPVQSGARRSGAHAPRRAERRDLVIFGQVAPSSLQLVLDVAVEVAAQTAELVLVDCRDHHFEEALAAPEDLHSVLQNHFDVSVLLFDVDHTFFLVREVHLLAVELDASLLLEVEAQIAETNRHSLRQHQGLEGFVEELVGHSYGKALTLALGHQQILPSSLEGVDFTVECLVVRVAEHHASTFNFDALLAALSGQVHQLGPGSAR
jgi:hypothetical protein